MTLIFQKRQREIKYKYSSLSGQISSNKQNKIVQFESSLERDYAYLLEFDCKVESYLEQPVVITYISKNGKIKRYTPDFYVSYCNEEQKSELVEIKYNDAVLKMDSESEEKLENAKLFCEENNILFRLITEKEIRHKRGIELKNYKFLSRHKSFFDSIDRSKTGFEVNMEKIFFIKQTVRKLKKCRIRDALDLCSSSLEERAEFIFLTWWMIANYSINIDFSKELSLDSEIWK